MQVTNFVKVVWHVVDVKALNALLVGAAALGADLGSHTPSLMGIPDLATVGH
jgi:hypothetical protein